MTFAKIIPTRFVQLARKRRNWLVGAGLLLVGAVVMFRGCGAPTVERNVCYNVKRGPFEVGITEGGSLRAVNEVVVRCELEGVSRIIKIVAEGTTVAKGDLLVELDSSDLRDRLIQQEVVCESAQFAYDQAALDLAIQKSIFESNVKDAELRLLFAKSDLEKYEEGDWPLQTNNLTSAKFIAREELQRAQDRLDWTEKLFKRDFATKTDLDADKLAVARNKITLSQADEQIRLAFKYDYPKKVIQLQSNRDNAEKELERVKQRGEASIAQYDANLISRKRSLDLQNEKLAQLKQQLVLTKIFAPQDGLVVYPFQQSWSSSSSQIEEGATVRQRQEIIKLPDVSQMLVDLKVHESFVNLIRPGLAANITIDSLPDSHFKGMVRKIAPLPDTQSRYSNPNLKVYSTEVLIKDQLPSMKPGVSARAEIIITNLDDVITVPIQAVTTLKGKQVCYLESVPSPLPTPVEVGMFNDKYIEIKKGLREGDRVLLSPPSASEATTSGEGTGGESTNQPPASAAGGGTDTGGAAVSKDNGAGGKDQPPGASGKKKKRKARPVAAGAPE